MSQRNGDRLGRSGTISKPKSDGGAILIALNGFLFYQQEHRLKLAGTI